MVEMKINGKRTQVFKIVSPSSARDRRIEVDGRMVTVEEYFRNKYQVSLRYPNAPLLVCRRGGSDSLFPMELCDVCDNQRVQQPQQTPTQLQGMRTTCIVPPATRLHQNELNAGALGLYDQRNTWLAGAGIKVEQRPVQVNARLLNAPAVGYAGNAVQVDNVRVLQYEVPLIRKAFANNGCAPNMRLLLLIVSKMHNVCIFPRNVNPRDRPSDQNLKPGTVVDSGAVHLEFPEFYLNSLIALQGSAKVPRYTVIVNDHGFNMDQLEEMTFQLCFAHEIVTLSTSTPTPLYMATRFAERGRVTVVQKSLSEEESADTANSVNVEETPSISRHPYRPGSLQRVRERRPENFRLFPSFVLCACLLIMLITR